MFYQTTIKSIGSGGIVDAQGRYLRFIGDLPVKEGDTVFTDGKYIFGHAPPKGSPAIFDEPCGIPVLGDEYSLSDGNPKDELRGYFTNRGKFKKYDVAQDDWITNSKKNFAHGAATFNGERVIDAEFSDSGDLFVVTDGFYRKCQCVKYNNHLFQIVTRYIQKTNSSTGAVTVSNHRFIDHINPIVGQEVTLGADASDIDKPVTIYKNGEKFLEISLGKYAQIAADECWNCYEELTADPEATDVPALINWECAQTAEPVNFIKQPPPPSEPFIALSYSRVEFFHVDQNGDWEAIISAAAYGHCFLNITLPCSLFYLLFNTEGRTTNSGQSKSFSESLLLGINALETAIFDENLYPFLDIEQYPEFKGQEKIDGEYTDEFKKYVENKLAYYIPLVRFKHYKWEPFIFKSNFLFGVHNGEIVTEIIKASGGGNEHQISEAWDEENYYGKYLFVLSTSEREYEDDIIAKNEWSCDGGNNCYLCGEGYKFQKIRTVDGGKEVDLGIEIYPYGGETNTVLASESPMRWSFMYDEVALELAGVTQEEADPSIPALREIYHRWIPSFFYIGYANYIIQYLKDADKEIYFPIWTHLSEETDDGWFRFNCSIAKLKDNDFLLGFYGGKLYIVDANGNIELVGDGVKNFRLREMKKISKARR